MSADLGPYVRFSELEVAVTAVAQEVIEDTEAARDVAVQAAGAAQTAQGLSEAARDASAASALAASGSASAASGSASAAAGSASAASGSASAANSSAIAAAGSASAASGSASAALASEQAADGYAQAADASAIAASGSASAAAGSASAASGSASAASGSASAASGSAAAALASQNAAAGSASAALASELDAEAARDTTINLAANAANAFGQLFAVTVAGITSGTPTNCTLRFTATEELDVWTTGDADVVSKTVSLEETSSFYLHVVVLSCPNNRSGFFVIGDAPKIRSFGNHRGLSTSVDNFYTGTDSTAPFVHLNIDSIPRTLEKFRQGNARTQFTASASTNFRWPTTLTELYLVDGITWVSNENYGFHEGMRVLFFSLTTNVSWTYSGALPSTLVNCFFGQGSNWSFDGAMPTGLTRLRLESNGHNWTGTVFGRDSAPFVNHTEFRLLNFRNPNSTVTPAELITLLQGLVNRVGTLPSSPVVTIAEYDLSVPIATIQSATPDIAGTTAEQIRYWIDQVKIKSTNFTLNSTAM
jgi:hypothetical protein